MTPCALPCPVCADPEAADLFAYHHLVVRSDLGPALAAAYAAQAAAASTDGAFYSPDNHVVVLAADRTQLTNLALLLRFETEEHGLRVFEVTEGDEVVALGVAPAPRASVRPYVEHLPLYGA